MSRYGIPYMGSKDFIAEKLLSALPKADHFYDLFGGGFSISHCALEMKKWKTVHYNEIKSDIVDLVKRAIKGEFNYERFKPEWITRERFFLEKEKNAYIRIIWSFANNQKNYLFGKDIEEKKRSLHQAVVFNEFDSFAKSVLNRERFDESLSIYQRRIISRRICGNKQLERLQQLQQLEQLGRLEQLQQLQQLEQLGRLERLERLQTSSLDYREVHIEPNSIIYCDPPYKETADYQNKMSFNSEEFFKWVYENKNPVYFSEYDADKRFELVFQKSKRQMFSPQKQLAKDKGVEKIYANEHGFFLL